MTAVLVLRFSTCRFTKIFTGVAAPGIDAPHPADFIVQFNNDVGVDRACRLTVDEEVHLPSTTFLQSFMEQVDVFCVSVVL